MKVAVCLFGLAGGKNQKYGGQKVDYKIGYDHYKKHILSKNNCDVFFHTWNTELEEPLKQLYNPKKCLFEKQIIFDKPSFLRKKLSQRPFRKHTTYSRWYSQMKAIELKQQYEKENGFTYDWVFVGRFDLAFFTDIPFDKLQNNTFYAAHAGRYVLPDGTHVPNNLYYEYEKKYDMSKLSFKHLAYPYNGEGLSDLWFVAPSKMMDTFGTLYNHLDSYLKKCPLSNHVLAEHHLRQTEMLHRLSFVLYRFKDFALVRRKFFGATR